MIYVTKHFKAEELWCPCCHGLELSPDLVSRLEALRMSLGVPLTINSGYRCEKHNAKVGGAKGSKHVTGEAVDIKYSDSKLAFRLVRAAMHLGFGGIGVASTFVHVDVRAPIDPRLWTY